eukprot:scaffold4914_cov108-Cylindrotheca_fusiformis.AAC.5
MTERTATVRSEAPTLVPHAMSLIDKTLVRNQFDCSKSNRTKRDDKKVRCGVSELAHQDVARHALNAFWPV